VSTGCCPLPCRAGSGIARLDVARWPTQRQPFGPQGHDWLDADAPLQNVWMRCAWYSFQISQLPVMRLALFPNRFWAAFRTEMTVNLAVVLKHKGHVGLIEFPVQIRAQPSNNFCGTLAVINQTVGIFVLRPLPGLLIDASTYPDQSLEINQSPEVVLGNAGDEPENVPTLSGQLLLFCNVNAPIAVKHARGIRERGAGWQTWRVQAWRNVYSNVQGRSLLVAVYASYDARTPIRWKIWLLEHQCRVHATHDAWTMHSLVPKGERT